MQFDNFESLLFDIFKMKLKNLLQRFFNEVSDFFEINELLSHLKFNGFKFGVSSEQNEIKKSLQLPMNL